MGGKTFLNSNKQLFKNERMIGLISDCWVKLPTLLGQSKQMLTNIPVG